jgi:hypothetical protein
MISDKAKRLHKRIQALFDNLSDQETISSLERDLMLSYLRELYDELKAPAPAARDKLTSPEDRDDREMRNSERPAGYTPVRPSSDWHETAEKETLATVEPHTAKTMHDTPVIQPSRTTSSQQQPMPEAIATWVDAHPEEDHLLAALFEIKEAGELAEKLKLQPIDRIEHGMGINERMLAINELFNGSNELFKKTLDHLNGLQTFIDARSYLMSGVASQYKWAEDVRKKKAIYFIQLVRRKYISN